MMDVKKGIIIIILKAHKIFILIQKESKMNFFRQTFEILTGTYKPPSTTTATSDTSAYNAYFGSNVSMTKDQLSSFDVMLGASGLTKPPGIDNLLQNFNSADTNHDGKLSSAEIQTYLTNNGFLSASTTTTANTSALPHNAMLNPGTGVNISSKALTSAINDLMELE